ncbi:IS5 family transposase [Dactylosporangium sp. NPDC005555]|uniref:IS5 family transposase n=1 Tax=Dactylosporangium sp. NPDC005555 TaxID=3154889 RepID=UPI0033A10A22
MPALSSSLLEPVFVQFAELWPERPEFDPTHPLGCHRRHIPNRVVFEHVIAALVHGSGYEVIATAGCSDRTIRRRLHLWAAAGLGEQIHALALDAYDRMIGLDLADVSADGAITKAPCGGDRAGRSPVDRGKGSMKRSTGVDGYGIPLGIVSATANRHDAPLLRDTFEACSSQLRHCWPEQITAHLDRGYDSKRSRDLLNELGFNADIARKGMPAPIQAGKRWVVERTNAWMNDFGKIRRCTDHNAKIIDFYLYLAAAIVTIRQLIQRARTLYR